MTTKTLGFLAFAFALAALAPASARAQRVLPPGENVHIGTAAGGPINLSDAGSGLVVQLPGHAGGLELTPTSDGGGLVVSMPAATSDASFEASFPNETSLQLSLPEDASAVVSFSGGSGEVVSLLSSRDLVSFPSGATVDVGGSGVGVQLAGGAPPIAVGNDSTGDLTITFPAQVGAPELTVGLPSSGSIEVQFPPEMRISLTTTSGVVDVPGGSGLVISMPAVGSSVVAYPAPGGLTVTLPGSTTATVAGQYRGLVVGPVLVSTAIVPTGAEEWAAGRFPLSACGKRVMTGDFNGDGLTDVVCGLDMGAATAAMWVYQSTGSGFSPSAWFTSGAGQFNMARCAERFVVGDFNNDGRDDVACGYDYGASMGELLIFVSTGSTFVLQGWYHSAAGQFNMAACGDRFRVGDFNGDGNDDIACGYDYGGLAGDLFAFMSTGSSFGLETWYRNGNQFSMPRCGARFVVGDFNHDGRDDVACGYDYGAATGELFAFVSTGSSFHLEGWYHSAAGQFSMPRCGARFVVGDYNGDGKDDIVCGYDYDESGGELFAFMSTGSGFGLRSWYRGTLRMSSCDGRFRAVDVNGDTFTDVACGYDYLDGHTSSIFHWLSTGTSGSFSQRSTSTTFNMATCGGRFLTGKLTRSGRRQDTVCAADLGDSNTRMYVWRAPRVLRTSAGQFMFPNSPVYR